jgi:hypothetical protein
MKICTRCKIVKDFSGFHKDKSRKDGHYPICKKCRKKKTLKPHLTEERKTFDRNMHNSMYRAIKVNKNGRAWEKLVGYTLEDLKEHLKMQFTEEMNWNNFGSFWWIDKIIPRAAYRYSNLSNNEFKKCWSLKNMRPLPKIDCAKKKNKIIWHLVDEYSLYDILPLGLIVIDKE